MSDEQKTEKKYPKVVAGVLVFNSRQEIFLIRAPHWSNKLVMPGGHVNYREKSEDAAIREIKEETNLDIGELKLLRVVELTEPADYGANKAHIIAFDYKAKLLNDNQEVKLDSREAIEYLWLKPEDIISRDDVEPTTKETIKECIIDKDSNITMKQFSHEQTKKGLFSKHCKECEKLKFECAEYKTGWQRALADYRNLQKETISQRAEWAQMSEQQILEEFIPVYDNFKTAFLHLPLPEGESTEGRRGWEQWTQGIAHIKKQFADILRAHGVEEIKTVGEKFDPKYHEAVGEEEAEGVEPGIIIKEVAGGYKMGERVIRAARVIVRK